MRVCSYCNEVKDESEFYCGRPTRCKECLREIDRQWCLANREKRRVSQRRWIEKQGEEFTARRREYQRKRYRELHPKVDPPVSPGPTRLCSMCGEEKNRTEDFYPYNAAKCKECLNVLSRQSYAEHQEARREVQNRWRSEHRDLVNARQREYARRKKERKASTGSTGSTDSTSSTGSKEQQ